MFLTPHPDSHYSGDDGGVLTYGGRQDVHFRICGGSKVLNGDRNPRLYYNSRLNCDSCRFQSHNNHLHLNRNNYLIYGGCLNYENDSNDGANCCDDGNCLSNVYACESYSPILYDILPYSKVPDCL